MTDKRMKRFFMTKDDAVDLILHAAELSQGGETFVLKMPIIQLIDLFEAMKIVLAPKFGLKPSQIKTKIIGIRRGEKLTENLLTNYELSNVLETKDFFIIPSMFDSSLQKKYKNAKKPKNIKNYFESLKPVSKLEIKKMLLEIY